MRNKEIKERFVNESTEDKQKRELYLGVFQDCVKFEDEKNKDISMFTFNEFANMMENLKSKYSRSMYASFNIGTVIILLKEYVKYVSDNQIS